MKFWDRFRLAFFNENINTILQKYADDFMAGEGHTVNNTAMDRETAMRYSAVFACVRVLAETKASLPLKLYRKNPNGEKKEADDISLHPVLTYRANEEMTPFNWKETSMTSLCLGGNSFSQKLVNSSGEIVGIYPLDYTKVRMDRNSNNRLIYKINSKEKEYTRDAIFHVPGLSFDGISGLTPIGYAAKAIELGLIYENFGVNFFNNSAIPSGVIYSEGPLNDGPFERFKKDFKKNYAGMVNKGVPMILEAGMKYTPLNVNQSDAQFLESKKFQLEDIARIYRVPLHLIQNLDRATNNNIEHQSLEFVMYTMLPWCKRDEENINMQLLTPEQQRAGYYAEYKMDSLLRGDAASRATAYATARQWGWMSVNDIRRLENMNPIANGDIYLQPMNMVEAGTVVTEQQRKDNAKAMAEEIYKMITERS